MSGGRSPQAEAGGRLGIRARVYLLMAIGIFFPLALMGGVGWFWLRTLDDRLLSSRVAAVTAVAAHFDQELNGDLELLQRLASNVGPHLGQGQRGVEEKAVLEAFAHFRHREAIFLLDTARTVLAEAPAGRISAAPKATLPLVEEVLRTGLPRLSGLLVDARGALVHELVPVRDYSGAVVGVAGGTFDPGRRGFDRMMALLRRGQTGAIEVAHGFLEVNDQRMQLRRVELLYRSGLLPQALVAHSENGSNHGSSASSR